MFTNTSEYENESVLDTKIKNSFLNNAEFNYLRAVGISNQFIWNEFYSLKVTIVIYKTWIDYNSYSQELVNITKENHLHSYHLFPCQFFISPIEFVSESLVFNSK